MIITWMCDLCGWANDNNGAFCHKCGGQTDERRIRGKLVRVIVKEPTTPMRGFYNPAVRRVQS